MIPSKTVTYWIVEYSSENGSNGHAKCFSKAEANKLAKLYKQTLITKMTLPNLKFFNKFIEDVGEIAKYALWQSDVGMKKAQEIIDTYHVNGEGGIWVQWEKALKDFT